MEELNNPRVCMIHAVIYRYAQDMMGSVSRWDCVNYLIGYYGSITADHITAIQLAVREGLIEV